jgi:prevent-host-death family protein
MMSTRKESLVRKTWAVYADTTRNSDRFREYIVKKVPATAFKTRCLAWLSEVAENHDTIIVTKHGKPVAQVVPYTTDEAVNPLKGSVLVETDLVAPLDETWDAEVCIPFPVRRLRCSSRKDVLVSVWKRNSR